MRTISMIVLSSIMFLFHMLLAPAISIFTAQVDFIVISILLIAAFSKKWYPTVICAVYSGLAVDMLSQPNTYINTGIYLFLGIVLGVLVKFYKKHTFVLISITAFICVAFKHLILTFLLYIMRLSSTATIGTFFFGLPSALYTGVVTIGFYFLYKGIFSFAFMEEKNEDSGKFLI